MTDDLIERLRALSRHEHSDYSIGDEAAAEIEALRVRTAVTMGVGTGDGKLFVHGDYDSIKAAQAIVLQRDALRAEVERLQEIVRPKREEECMTLDHWRMRAYDLEANWSRCSRACADEQTKRIKAEARAKRLAEALQKLAAHARPTCSVLWREAQAALRDHDQEDGK